MSENGDKRSVSTDALETLGMIIGDAEKRDAIHLAVEPIEAGEKLYAGQDIGIINGLAYHNDFEGPLTHLGIVDPFLKEPVQAGQRFWLVVYPRQIKSLRHVWTHPAFAENADVDTSVTVRQSKKSKTRLKTFSEETVVISAPTVIDHVAISKEWIKNYCIEIGCRVDELMSHADEWVGSHDGQWGGEYWVDGGRWEGTSLNPEFWAHYETVVGKHVEERMRSSFFSCSC